MERFVDVSEMRLGCKRKIISENSVGYYIEGYVWNETRNTILGLLFEVIEVFKI